MVIQLIEVPDLYDWCPYKKKKSGHRQDYVKAKGKDSHLQTKDRVLTMNSTLPTPYLGLLACNTVRSKFLLFKSPCLWYIIMTAVANNIYNKGISCIFSGICYFHEDMG